MFDDKWNIILEYLTTNQISETVIEDRFALEHGSEGWYDALDRHFKWLLQYRISPYFCRWGDSMRILAYTCPWPGMPSLLYCYMFFKYMALHCQDLETIK